MRAEELTDKDRRRIRARLLLDRWFVAAVVVLVVAVALGGWLAYEPHVDPGADERIETVGSWSEEPDLSHQAEVRVANPIFETGSTLSDRSLYYTRLSPELEGTYEYAYRLEGVDGSVDVVMDSYLLFQSVDDDGNAYWQRTEPLDSESIEGVEPGERVTTSFAVNVTELDGEIEAIEGNLGASPGSAETAVVVEARVDGEIGDERVSNAHTATFLVDDGGGTYSVETDTDGDASREFRETVVTERSYGPVRSYGPFFLVVLGVAVLGALGYARVEGRLTPTDAEIRALESAREREEFDDWLSHGRFPEAEFSGPRIELDTLEDIVDVAIDSDRRVIEDATRGAYYVQDGDLYYAYVPEEWPAAAGELEAAGVGGNDGSERGPGAEGNEDVDGGKSAYWASEQDESATGAAGSGVSRTESGGAGRTIGDRLGELTDAAGDRGGEGIGYDEDLEGTGDGEQRSDGRNEADENTGAEARNRVVDDGGQTDAAVDDSVKDERSDGS